MVNVQKGVLIKCDPAMKQYLKNLDEQRKLGKSFIIRELDDVHLFVDEHIVSRLEDKIDEMMDSLAPDQPEQR
ncbi:transcription factor TFIIH complex subunit tfb5 domain-containing protein [Ditylenchus destructor]|uniref:General transcription and DNA repair factor IIH subunit TFB5 n=1 Tax=Ditylenchus destructor TaxID=166010 RepID=A0AAD4N3M1_9BILA|nr:transcription factor TFIIH complex subunit tfb5 domain-containing protein [Ditylenchus destructor]